MASTSGGGGVPSQIGVIDRYRLTEPDRKLKLLATGVFKQRANSRIRRLFPLPASASTIDVSSSRFHAHLLWAKSSRAEACSQQSRQRLSARLLRNLTRLT